MLRKEATKWCNVVACLSLALGVDLFGVGLLHRTHSLGTDYWRRRTATDHHEYGTTTRHVDVRCLGPFSPRWSAATAAVRSHSSPGKLSSAVAVEPVAPRSPPAGHSTPTARAARATDRTERPPAPHQGPTEPPLITSLSPPDFYLRFMKLNAFYGPVDVAAQGPHVYAAVCTETKHVIDRVSSFYQSTIFMFQLRQNVRVTKLSLTYKGNGLDTCYSATYMSQIVTSSALQSRKWQLIGVSQWCRSALYGRPLPALTDNWTHGAASRHTIAPISHTRPSPRSRSYYSFPVPLRVGG